jgi:hypothetical protein
MWGGLLQDTVSPLGDMVHLKIFIPRTTKPEKLRSTQKLPDIVQIQVCKKHGPRGSDEATMGKTIFAITTVRARVVLIYIKTL